MLRREGFRIIRGSIPAEVRKALREAVKNGELGHLPRKGLLPEVFCHPDKLDAAQEARSAEAMAAIFRISRVVVGVPPSRQMEPANT